MGSEIERMEEILDIVPHENFQSAADDAVWKWTDDGVEISI